MSTTSFIGVLNDDNTIDYIYCRKDGYPEHNGKILYNHYDYDKARRLVALGDICYLGECLTQEEKGNSHLEVVCAYHRDFDEDIILSKCNNEEEYIKKYNDRIINYAYLIDKDNKWTIYTRDGAMPLEQVLKKLLGDKCDSEKKSLDDKSLDDKSLDDKSLNSTDANASMTKQALLNNIKNIHKFDHPVDPHLTQFCTEFFTDSRYNTDVYPAVVPFDEYKKEGILFKYTRYNGRHTFFMRIYLAGQFMDKVEAEFYFEGSDIGCAERDVNCIYERLMRFLSVIKSENDYTVKDEFEHAGMLSANEAREMGLQARNTKYMSFMHDVIDKIREQAQKGNLSCLIPVNDFTHSEIQSMTCFFAKYGYKAKFDEESLMLSISWIY